MKVKQALKYKKKLASKMNQEFGKVQMYNSVEEGSARVYDVKESMQNWLRMSEELVELKTKLHLANGPVYGKIFRMSELKSQLSNLKSLDCVEGKYSDRYGRMSGMLQLSKPHKLVSWKETKWFQLLKKKSKESKKNWMSITLPHPSKILG